MKKELKERAIKLRKEGYSIREIHQTLGISKSTASLWARGVSLDSKARMRLSNLREGSLLKSIETHQQKTKLKKEEAEFFAKENNNNNLNFNKNTLSILCALVYFCEGNKDDSSMRFTNSDPLIISTFLKLIRECFYLDERKFRVCLHIHSYHEEKQQVNFWSAITNIPKEQFHKSYNKKSIGKYKKEGYEGCVQIRYYDTSISRKLLAISRLFMQQYTS